MGTERVGTVIIGAGQAGLATAYHLQRRREPCVVLEENACVGDNWRAQWDSLKLYTPAKYDGLPGMPFPGDRWSLPTKDQVADYLAAYADRFELPVRTRTRVHRLGATEDGFTVDTGDATILAENVVVATGTYGRTPNLPEYAVDLDPSIRQLHSSEYRRPSQLRDGSVLVVGASSSGMDIAYELAESRPTVLCGRDCGQEPVRPESAAARLVDPVFVFLARHVITRRGPLGRKVIGFARFRGKPAVRVRRKDLATRGVERVLDRVVGVRNGLPLLAGGRSVDVDNVLWCTGFRQDFSWIDLPVIGEDGWPKEMRGIVDSTPGLYFCGLAFQSSVGSGLLPGVGRDASFLARRVVAGTRPTSRTRAPSAA